MKLPVPVRYARRILYVVGAALACCLAPIEAAADCPSPVTGTLSIGDGSSGTAVSVQSMPTATGWFDATLPGPATVLSFPSPGSYTFKSNGGALYFDEFGGSATCTAGCACTGTFTLVHYARQGNIRGVVTHANGTPAVDYQVTAVDANGSGYYRQVQTLTDGSYDFSPPLGGRDQQNWGLLVGRPPNTTGTGTGSYNVYVFNNNQYPVTIHSSQTTTQNISIP